MIRVFIAPWSLNVDHVTNPVVEYVNALPNMGIICSMTYGDADGDGLPDHARVIVLCQFPAQYKSEVEAIAVATGCLMLTPMDLRVLMNGVPQANKDVMVAALNAEGIPYSVVQGSVTAKEVLGRICKAIQITHPGEGVFNGIEGEFA